MPSIDEQLLFNKFNEKQKLCDIWIMVNGAEFNSNHKKYMLRHHYGSSHDLSPDLIIVNTTLAASTLRKGWKRTKDLIGKMEERNLTQDQKKKGVDSARICPVIYTHTQYSEPLRSLTVTKKRVLQWFNIAKKEHLGIFNLLKNYGNSHLFGSII